MALFFFFFFFLLLMAMMPSLASKAVFTTEPFFYQTATVCTKTTRSGLIQHGTLGRTKSSRLHSAPKGASSFVLDIPWNAKVRL